MDDLYYSEKYKRKLKCPGGFYIRAPFNIRGEKLIEVGSNFKANYGLTLVALDDTRVKRSCVSCLHEKA